MTFTPTIENCDNYLAERTGKYEQRAIRYRHAIQAMIAAGLDDTMTIMDVGAGWTEFDYCLRVEFGWRGRYIPIDGGIDGTDIETWDPPREVDWVVALEILEHIYTPYSQTKKLQEKARKGMVFSTPNPRTTDVLGMDSTHVICIDANLMRTSGFKVTEETFYGGRFSNGEPDSLFGIWVRP